MKRIVSTALLVSLLALVSVFAVAPAPLGSVAYAEVSDTALMDQLTKIKEMAADIEMKMKAKKMMMDAMGKEKTMERLMEVNRMLEEIERQRP